MQIWKLEIAQVEFWLEQNICNEQRSKDFIMCFIKSNVIYIQRHKIINAFSIIILYLSMYLKIRLKIHLYPMEHYNCNVFLQPLRLCRVIFLSREIPFWKYFERKQTRAIITRIFIWWRTNCYGCTRYLELDTTLCYDNKMSRHESYLERKCESLHCLYSDFAVKKLLKL